ncbi:hypothetical protein GWK47_046657 [Chionoecetes opilio]|uniref:Uncharacterized protein n=1 Tax=Chionoecetes opilio TaxID=41210 RepID=A0A8J4YCU4_CHIOP|nr:hypothetical protein GWK47_046657 [Chionoecetes opilio]
MKIPKPLETSSTRDHLVPSWKEARLAMERGPVKKSQRIPPGFWQPFPPFISPEPRRRQKAGSLPPRPLEAKGKLRSQNPHVPGPRAKTTREGRGLKRRSLRRSPLLARWMEAGVGTEMRTTTQPCEGPAPLPGDQRAMGKTPTPFSPISGTSARLLGVSLFFGGINGGEEKMRKKREGKGPRPKPVQKRCGSAH